MIVPGIFVCSSFLISVCMFIVSKALLISVIFSLDNIIVITDNNKEVKIRYVY